MKNIDGHYQTSQKDHFGSAHSRCDPTSYGLTFGSAFDPWSLLEKANRCVFDETYRTPLATTGVEYTGAPRFVSLSSFFSLLASKTARSPSSSPTYTLPSATSVEPHMWAFISCVQYSFPVSASKQCR